jgi:hypothetical protein
MSKLILGDVQDPIYVGDTWPGFTVEYKENDVAVNLTGATVRMTLKNHKHSIALSSETGGFTITQPTLGKFRCNPINRMDYPCGLYVGDLEVTLNTLKRTTLIEVELYLKDDTTK